MILHGKRGRKALLVGVNAVADTVKQTMGYGGRNVILDKGNGYPHITKDGVTVAQSVIPEDLLERMGAQLIKDAAQKTATEAGDGTTTVTVLVQKMIQEGLKAHFPYNVTEVKEGMQNALNTVVEALKEQATPIRQSDRELDKVAIISANNDLPIGTLIADTFRYVGENGVITVEEGSKLETEVEYTEGMELKTGLIADIFATNQVKHTAEYKDCLVAIYEGAVFLQDHVIEPLRYANQQNKPILFFADDFSSEALRTLVAARIQNQMQIVACKSPSIGSQRKNLLGDIAAITGAQIIKVDAETETEGKLGFADSIYCTRDTTTIAAENEQGKQMRIAQIKVDIEHTANAWDKEKLQERLAKLTGGVAVISVGGGSEMEIKERKDRIDDAVAATRAAIEEGIVDGGGYTLATIARKIQPEKNFFFLTAFGFGQSIVKSALSEPLKQIARNAGYNPNKVLRDSLKYKAGFDVKVGDHCDMRASGIIDPVKVTRVAIQNAVSTAAIFLTIESVVSTKTGK